MKSGFNGVVDLIFLEQIPPMGWGFNFVLSKSWLPIHRLLFVCQFCSCCVCVVRSGQVALYSSTAGVRHRQIQVFDLIYRYYRHFAVTTSLVRLLVLLPYPDACFQSPDLMMLVPNTPSSEFNRPPTLKK